MKPRPYDSSAVLFRLLPTSSEGAADLAEEPEWLQDRPLLSALHTHTHTVKRTREHKHVHMKTDNLRHTVSAPILEGSVSLCGTCTIVEA